MITVNIQTQADIKSLEAIKTLLFKIDPSAIFSYEKESDSYPLEEAPSIKMIMAEFKKRPKEEQEALIAEVKAEAFGN